MRWKRGRPPVRSVLTRILLPGLLVLLLSAPTVSARSPPAPASSPSPPAPVLPTTSFARPHATPTSASLPGSDPSHEPFLDVPALALQRWEAAQARLNHTSTALPPAVPAPLRTGILPAVPSGTVTGRVYDSTFGQPIAGVVIGVIPVSTTFCGPGGCNSTTTDSQGAFSVSAPVGAIVLTMTAGAYVANRTWLTVPAGGTVSLGVLYLVHDGYVTGVVEDDSPSHGPIAGAQLSAISRDGSIYAVEQNTTAPNGSFRQVVPPVPTQVNFASPGNPPPFEANATFVNLTPYATLDLGVIYLEGGVPITATLVDRVTGLPLNNQTPIEIQFCTRRAVFCMSPILNENGSRPTAFGLPGAAQLKVYALGYVSNITTIADLPSTESTVDLGTIYMVPLAAIEISTNFTGGSTPVAGPWSLGDIVASVCSLDGLGVSFQIAPGFALLPTPCWPRGAAYPFLIDNYYSIGTTTIVIGAPLRDAIYIHPPPPGSAGVFPYATDLMSSLTPLFPASFANVTWVNASPDRVTYAGSVDVSPGTYLYGNVSIPGVPGSLENHFTVQACSTDAPEVCGNPVFSSDLMSVPGCPSSPNTFCAPAPPGPVEVVITEIGNLVTNRTWVEVPRGCCAQDGSPTNIGWLNLTLPNLYGNLSGVAVGQTGLPGSATVPINGVLATVQSCPSGPAPPGVPSVACTFGILNETTGAFNFSAPLGWDKVSVFAKGYQSNWTWVDVTGNNTTGVIELAPLAVLVGSVQAVGASPVYDAVVEACPVAAITQCVTFGVSSSDGHYNGTVEGGPLPWGTYLVTASAAGFTSSWTWVNTTPGRVLNVPVITLAPIGTGGPVVSRVAASNGSVGAWVDGRLVDADTGLGVPDALVNECSIVTGGCLGAVQAATAGGTFNVSLLTGQYYLLVSADGYPDSNFYVNATASVVHLGSLSMHHYPWVSGRVLVRGWESLGESVGVGAPATVLGCAAVGTPCGRVLPTNTGGFFNVSVPGGTTSQLTVLGEGQGGFGSAIEGFDRQILGLSVLGRYVQLPTDEARSIALAPFGAFVGDLRDGSTWNATLGVATAPCPFCLMVVTPVNSTQAGYFTSQVGPGGNYTLFLPSDETSTTLGGTGFAYWGDQISMLGSVTPASTTNVPPLYPMHYGWVDLKVVDLNTSIPLPYAYVTVLSNDPVNHTVWSIGSQARGDGFVNVTAPLGAADSVAILAPGYFNRTVTVGVSPSQTVGLGDIGLTGGAPPNGTFLMGQYVNTVNVPPTPTVVDGHTRAPVPEAQVVGTNSQGISSDASLQTNGLGQFLLYAPAAVYIGVTVQRAGFALYNNFFNISGRASFTVPQFNLTGLGIVAGRVVAEPAGTPAYDQLVEVCPAINPGCSQYTYTNSNGEYWVAANPGSDVVTVVSGNYLANQTIGVNVVTDSWKWVGTLPVFSFAGILGTVRGLPTGAPIVGATVAICSPFGTPTGPCDASVPTDANGSFYLSSPPATFIVQVSANGFNTTYRPIVLFPGVNLSLGNIFLLADGVVRGQVVSDVNGLPVPTATVIACATYAFGGCSPFTPVAADGSFVVIAPPGPVLITASAPNYFDNFTQRYVPSGGTLSLGAIALEPLSANIPETVRGTVVANGTGAPIPGAFVTAILNGVTIASAATDGAGGFTLPVVWGTYVIVAAAPGFATGRVGVVVHTNVTGVQLVLETMRYSVSGTVRDSWTGSGIPGAEIRMGTELLATSDGVGAYQFAVPNGSYVLSASGPGGAYAVLSFSVVVSGASVVRDLGLTPLGSAVTGVVVDAISGVPIAGAVLTVTGSGLSALSQFTGIAGRFSVSLPPGTYHLNVSATGYESNAVVATVPSAGAITIALTPLSGGGGSAFSVPLPILLGAFVGAAVAASVAVVLWRRRPPAAPPLPRWTIEELDEPGVERR